MGAARTSTRSGAGGSARLVVLASVVAFVGLGFPEGAIGITFPAITKSFGVALSALGLLLYPYTGGYMTATIAHGRLSGRVRIAYVLLGAAACACVGALAFATGPAFAVLMIGSYLLGVSAGAIDASLNSYVSVHLEHRVLAFMHGGFGLGATLGPLAVVAILNAGWSWRVAYAALAMWHIGLGVTWFALRGRFVVDPAIDREIGEHDEEPTRVVGFEGDVAATATAATPARHPRHPRGAVGWLNVMMFFLYTGAEGSTGFLVATLLIDRGVSTDAAGALTTAYWFSLTIGRFATGAIGPRLSPSSALLIGSAGVVVGANLVALGGTALAAPGLVVLGLSLAPFFPSLVALTPARVGADRAASAIGVQLAAASLGVATVPSLITLLADRTSRAAIAPGLFVAALCLAVGHLVTAGVAGDLRRSDVPPPARA